METRANYALIGAFTLGILACAFGFIFWFSGAEKTADLRQYKVVFAGSISGLAVGNPVLFNGVRVGEVTKIDLMSDDPSRVYALVNVDARVPVRTDTHSRLEYTGLTGSASVGLTGGSGDAPVLATSAGSPGVLNADRSDFQDLIQTAQRVAGRASDILDKGDKILSDNTGLINASVRNVAKFSDALAANADGVKDFMAAMADVGRSIKPLTAKLETLTTDTDAVVKAVDPKEVKQIVSEFAALSSQAQRRRGQGRRRADQPQRLPRHRQQQGHGRRGVGGRQIDPAARRQHRRPHARDVRQPHAVLEHRPQAVRGPRRRRAPGRWARSPSSSTRWRPTRSSSCSARNSQLLPIRMPVASTSPPPSMTLNAAASGALSM